jgi:biopolymer transport protein ExbB
VLDQPRELIEEAMFEKVLQAKFKINRFIPFIAVTAACAPLLGLLGTVTGIISTFKLMTIFGSGDVKVLSSGISEALITTEYGLYIAIPAVLIHSFLSRKAKSFEDRLEQIAIRFMGEIGKV